MKGASDISGEGKKITSNKHATNNTYHDIKTTFLMKNHSNT